MNIPLNQEHKEAEQNAANKKREAFVAGLSKKDKKKFAAITKAVEMLVKADVLFYLFPYLPSHEFKDKMQIWQWNSLASKMEFAKDGKITEESRSENNMFHEAFFSLLFNQFNGFFPGETLEMKLQSMAPFFYHCMKNHSEYLETPDLLKDKK